MTKNYIIIGLSLLALILFFINNRGVSKLTSNLDKIKKDNVLLHHKNDSLNEVNFNLLKSIAKLDNQIKVKDSLISLTNIKIDKLKTKLNEINTNVNNLGANDVASEINQYLQRK